MTLQISCPHCGSLRVQSFKVIHLYGTSRLATDATTVGGGIVAGCLAFGGAKTKTNGFQQTKIGKLTAPPAKRQEFAILVFIGLVVGALVFLNFLGGILGMAIDLLITLVIGHEMYQSIQYDRTVWPKLYDEWLKKFLCNTCGEAFVRDKVDNDGKANY